MRGANEQEADVREFITTYRTRFTPTRAFSLSRVIRSFLPFYHSPMGSMTGAYIVIGLPSLWGVPDVQKDVGAALHLPDLLLTYRDHDRLPLQLFLYALAAHPIA